MLDERRKSDRQRSVTDVEALANVGASAVVLKECVHPVLKGHVGGESANPPRLPAGAYTRIQADIVAAITNIHRKISRAVNVLVPADPADVAAESPARLHI